MVGWAGTPHPHLGLTASRELVSPFFPALINTRMVGLAGMGGERKPHSCSHPPEPSDEMKLPKQSSHLSSAQARKWVLLWVITQKGGVVVGKERVAGKLSPCPCISFGFCLSPSN